MTTSPITPQEALERFRDSTDLKRLGQTVRNMFLEHLASNLNCLPADCGERINDILNLFVLLENLERGDET